VFFLIFLSQLINIVINSGVIRGHKRETSASRRSTLGAPNWGRNVT